MRVPVQVRSFGAAVALAAAVGCELSPAGVGTVRLYLTDAPAADVASAQVWVSRAYLVKAGDGAGEPFVTITDEAREFDLLTLQNGVTALLGSAAVPTGQYAQLRLVVDSARVTLGGGMTFAGGSNTRTLFVPSGMQTGIKVNFRGALMIDEGENVVTVDFPVDRNFVFLGPAGTPMGVLFTPTLQGTIE